MIKQRIQFIISIFVIALSGFQGLRMIIDGIYNITTGKYIGENDYWWYLVKALDLTPEKWGIIFIIFGFLWLMLTILYLFYKVPARISLGILCLLTMWNILYGALISLIIFILNFFSGNQAILKTHRSRIKEKFNDKLNHIKHNDNSYFNESNENKENNENNNNINDSDNFKRK
ncbi:MAG: hypothetical protein ACOCV8_00810 [Spirochaetota bacterium]